MNGGAAGLCIAALLVAASPAAMGANVLPIYIEDNHAGTFYWLAQRVDLDQPCTIVHFDAHSDASGLFDSDDIRNALRNVASRQSRQTLLDRWRSKGVVQCFDWIEPLMPAPIAKVIWVPAEKISPTKFASAQKRQQRYSTATSKQRRGNRDHYVHPISSPILKAFRNISLRPSRWL